MKKIFLSLMVIILIFSFSSCKKNKKQTIRGLINKRIEALNNEDIEGILETMHSKSPNRDKIKKFYERTFNSDNKLKYTLKKMEIIDNQKDLKVKTEIDVNHVEGPKMMGDHKLTRTFILQKENDQWKIFSSKINRFKNFGKNEELEKIKEKLKKKN